ncbi:hypothetical protein OH458_18225 [Vibrio sp. MarTm2]|uniref:O-antigen ligase family protein n=1 Tax=Vibrio sp. MarTm2 TaxID=2998831 RepID=UPI0022CD7D5A|nr:O-antigen ligase family protein [Vibrio sp. MarTm2]MDA0130015.1 hypothetical protein [Vibrio sp. MarTm2]
MTGNTLITTLEGGVTRVYIPAYFYALLTMLVTLALFISDSLPKYRSIFLVLLTTSAISILLSYTRTYWIASLLGVLMIYIYSNRDSQRKLINYVVVTSIILTPIILYQGGDFIIYRIGSIFSEVGSHEGNFVYRFSENPQRLEAFFDNPIFGPGFVHSSYAAQLFNFVIDESGLSEAQIERALLLQTNDSGLITLLVSFGLVGCLWVLMKLLVLHRMYRSVLDDNLYRPAKAVQLGVLAFIFSVWLTCITTYGFTYPDGIVALVLSLFFMSHFYDEERRKF